MKGAKWRVSDAIDRHVALELAGGLGRLVPRVELGLEFLDVTLLCVLAPTAVLYALPRDVSDDVTRHAEAQRMREGRKDNSVESRSQKKKKLLKSCASRF